jgi:hypothetical protein
VQLLRGLVKHRHPNPRNQGFPDKRRLRLKGFRPFPAESAGARGICQGRGSTPGCVSFTSVTCPRRMPCVQPFASTGENPSAGGRLPP